ncbi:MAG: methyltransferase, partial [archaeon]|nr:methyltransferase [archaeon]
MKYFYKKFELEIPETIYFPREDSEILTENIHAKKNSFVLDLGTGSGIQAIIALSQGARVLSVDVDENALKCCENNVKTNKLQKNHSIRKSNLFESIPEKFDLILFNPPYVPTNEIKFAETDGGKLGRKIIDEFLQ